MEIIKGNHYTYNDMWGKFIVRACSEKISINEYYNSKTFVGEVVHIDDSSWLHMPVGTVTEFNVHMFVPSQQYVYVYKDELVIAPYKTRMGEAVISPVGGIYVHSL